MVHVVLSSTKGSERTNTNSSSRPLTLPPRGKTPDQGVPGLDLALVFDLTLSRVPFDPSLRLGGTVESKSYTVSVEKECGEDRCRDE